MWRLATALGLCLALAFSPTLTAAEAAATDPEVVKGIQLVDDGEFDAAILTLDNAARRLAAEPSKARELSQAYLYLGIAYVGKGHEAAAKAKFREALQQIKDITLSPDKYPPKVIDVFEAARSESTQAAKTAPPTAAKPAEKTGGGSKKGILIGVGVAAAAGVGIAVAAGGGGGGSATPPPSTQPPDPRGVNMFGPTDLTEDQYEENYKIVVASSGIMDATVTWTSRGGERAAVLAMNLFDGDDNHVATSNRTNDTTSAFSATVQPRSAGVSQEYRIQVFQRDTCNGCTATFTLTVKHP
jgi:hypothetical protein